MWRWGEREENRPVGEKGKIGSASGEPVPLTYIKLKLSLIESKLIVSSKYSLLIAAHNSLPSDLLLFSRVRKLISARL
jgi:hypothetical protein